MAIKGQRQIETELSERRERLFGGAQPELLHALQEHMPTLRDAIILGHIPEQFEDIFEVLVNPNEIAIVEIDRESRRVTSFATEAIDDYERNLSGRRKRELMVAREMMHGKATTRHPGR